MNFFITGTDTDVGKTYVCALLLRALRKTGINAVGMKPICCGDRDDAEILHRAGDPDVSIDEVNPVWLREPAAPYIAAKIEQREIDLDFIKKKFAVLRRKHQS